MDINFGLRFLVMKTLSKILTRSNKNLKHLNLDKLDATCDIIWEEVKDDFFTILEEYSKNNKIITKDSEYQLFFIERRKKLKKKYPDLSDKEFEIKFNKCIPNIEQRWIKYKSKYINR